LPVENANGAEGRMVPGFCAAAHHFMFHLQNWDDPGAVVGSAFILI
jgi:hypothetical protein